MSDFEVTPKRQLTTAVASAGTFTLDYPLGFGPGDFGPHAPKHKLLVGANLYEDSNYFSLAFGASNITVTWNGTGTIAAGVSVQAQLDKIGGADTRFSALDVPARVRNIYPVSLTLGAPATAAAAALRAAAAVGGAGALTLITAALTLDVPRNITILSAGNDSGITFTVLGKDEYNAVVTEVITGANAGTATGIKAFKKITSITASGAAAGNVSVGFGVLLGLPIWVPSTAVVLKEIIDNGAAVAGTFAYGLARATKSTGVTADVRGTYSPNSAPNGARNFTLVVLVDEPTYKGNAQFAG